MTALARPAAAGRRRDDSAGRPPLRALDRPVRRPRDRRLLLVVGGGLLFAAALAGNVAVHAQTTQGQFELERLQATARHRQATYQQLRLQVAELEAPQRIAVHARQMGMVEPASVTYLTPTASTATGGPAPTPAPGSADTGDQAAQSWAHVKPHLDGRR